MDPQDGKSSRRCKSACEESHDQQRFKRFVCVVSPQRIVKKVVPTVRHLIIIIMTIFNEETFSLKSGLQKGPRKLKIRNLQ